MVAASWSDQFDMHSDPGVYVQIGANGVVDLAPDVGNASSPAQIELKSMRIVGTLLSERVLAPSAGSGFVIRVARLKRFAARYPNWLAS